MKSNHINRRQLGIWAAAALAVGAQPVRAQAPARKPYLADMHSHYGQFLPRLFGFDLAKHMQETGTMLLAWSVTDDNRWIGPHCRWQLAPDSPAGSRASCGSRSRSAWPTTRRNCGAGT